METFGGLGIRQTVGEETRTARSWTSSQPVAVKNPSSPPDGAIEQGLVMCPAEKRIGAAKARSLSPTPVGFHCQIHPHCTRGAIQECDKCDKPTCRECLFGRDLWTSICIPCHIQDRQLDSADTRPKPTREKRAETESGPLVANPMVITGVAVLVAAFTWPGQRTIIGTRIPPS